MQQSMFDKQNEGAGRVNDDRPAVMVSKCLAGVACRYHGQMSPPREDLLRRLRAKYRVILVCPEQLGGLPVPRPAARWRNGRLIAAGQDVTPQFELGAARTLEQAQAEGVIKFYGLKQSPSCDRERGLAAQLLQKHGIKVLNG